MIKLVYHNYLNNLFIKTVRSFEQLSLETIDSDIYSTNDGKYAMNTFICRHKILGGNLIQRDIQNIEQKIINAISSEDFKAASKLKTRYKKVFEHSTRVLAKLSHHLDGAIPLIGVGGIGSAAAAYAKIKAGASAVQLYTAIVYIGLSLGAKIADGLDEMLKADGIRTVANAVGIERDRWL